MSTRSHHIFAAVGMVVLFLVAQLVASALALTLTNFSALSAGGAGGLSAVPKMWHLGLSMLLAFLVLIALLALLKLTPWPFLRGGLRRWPARWWQSAIGLPLISVGVSFLLAPLHLDDGGTTAFFADMLQSPLCWLVLCLVGPLTEEVVFREGVLRSLLQAGYSRLTAVLASALVFGLVHANLAQAIPAFILGLLLGLLYLRTGDIRLSLVAHVANNTLAVLFMLIPTLDGAPDLLPLPVGLLVGCICTLAGLWLMRDCLFEYRYNNNSVTQ